MKKKKKADKMLYCFSVSGDLATNISSQMYPNVKYVTWQTWCLLFKLLTIAP